MEFYHETLQARDGDKRLQVFLELAGTPRVT
jgi:hypothetical protein